MHERTWPPIRDVVDLSEPTQTECAPSETDGMYFVTQPFRSHETAEVDESVHMRSQDWERSTGWQ